MSLHQIALANDCAVCKGEGDNCFVDDRGVIYCNNVLISYPADCTEKEYTVDARTVTIGEEAFHGNYYLEKVILQEGVMFIEDYAFMGTPIKEIILPDSLLLIKSSAFDCCCHLENIIFPPNLYAIGESAFSDCYGLTSVTIPASVRFIGEMAFNCTNIDDITLEGDRYDISKNFLYPLELHYADIPITVHVGAYHEEDNGELINFSLRESFPEWADIIYLYDIHNDSCWCSSCKNKNKEK